MMNDVKMLKIYATSCGNDSILYSRVNSFMTYKNLASMTHLLFPVEDAVEQVSNNSGAFVTYTALKERYDHLLNRCNHFLGEDLSEEGRKS